MIKRYYKILLFCLYLAALLCVIYLIWWHYAIQLQDKSRQAPKYYDAAILNQDTSYAGINNGRPYELPYLRIKNIGFKLDKEFIYVKLQLAGQLPEANHLPSVDGDQLANIYYTVSLDENYFDYSGNKNPGGPEVELILSLYESNVAQNSQRISIEGEMLKGGPGFDFIVVKYPFQQLLANRNTDFIVFTAQSHISSPRFPEGVITNEFRNAKLAATPSNDAEVLLDVSLRDLKY